MVATSLKGTPFLFAKTMNAPPPEIYKIKYIVATTLLVNKKTINKKNKPEFEINKIYICYVLLQVIKNNNFNCIIRVL